MSRRLLRKSLLQPVLRRANCCLAVGSDNRAFYEFYGVPPERIVFAPYSVDNVMFARAGAAGRAHRIRLLESIELDQTLPTVLFAGKLQPQKRPTDFLSAVCRMERRANAIVIGDGPLRPQLEGTARKLSSVRMLGFVNQSEIGRWYGLADVFVMPSEHEPWGLAINEAMAAGSVPVVSEAVGCGPDLVTSESGRIVPVGDVDALAGTLDELVGDDHLLDQMRKRGDQVLANYSIEATARGVEDGAIMATGTGLSS